MVAAGPPASEVTSTPGGVPEAAGTSSGVSAAETSTEVPGSTPGPPCLVSASSCSLAFRRRRARRPVPVSGAGSESDAQVGPGEDLASRMRPLSSAARPRARRLCAARTPRAGSAAVRWESDGAGSCASGSHRPAVNRPLRHRVAHERGESGSAHDPSRAKRVEGGGRADKHAERAGLEGARAGGIEATSGNLDGGHGEHGGLAGWEARPAGGLQEEGRPVRGCEGAEVSRYAREMGARALAGVRPETTGHERG